MDSLAIKDLHVSLNSLGSLNEGKYIKEVDTNLSLRDVLRHLHKYTYQCHIRLELSKMNAIKHFFIPLLKCRNDDENLLIRLMMN